MAGRFQKRKGGNRPAFERLMIIYGRLRFPEARQLNCRSLSKELEVSEKTVFRDIEFLRDRIGMPVVFDHQKQAYVTDFSAKLPWVIRANEQNKL